MSSAADPHALLPAFVGGYWGQSAGAAVRDAGGGSEALAEARGALALAAGRGNAPAAVRAFTPNRDGHGYESPGSALETNTLDLPFLVDSVSAEITTRGIGIVRVVHPIVSILRDESGQILALGDEDNGTRESIMHFELDRRLDPQELADLETGVRDVLASVAVVVEDFPKLVASVERLKEVAPHGAEVRGTLEAAPAEIQAFLQWLADDNLVFLGYREETGTDESAAPVPGTELGLLRARTEGGIGTDAELHIGSVGDDRRLLRVMRSQALSPVHRHEPMLTVLVRKISEDGSPDGVCRLLGLMTSRAAAEPASRTPLLRSKLEHIVNAEQLVHGSHDYKAAVALFDHFPKGELLASPVSDLRQEIATLIGTPPGEVRVVGRMAPHRHAASLVALLPRQRVTPELRVKVRGIVADAYRTTIVEIHESLGEDDRALLHIRGRSKDALPDLDVQAIEQQIREQSRTWVDRVRDRLEEDHGPEAGRVLAARWAECLPDSYKANTEPPMAAADIAGLERLTASRTKLHVGFDNAEHTDGRNVTRVVLYKSGPKIELTDAAPLLEAHGLRVIDENPTRVADQGDETWIQAFAVVDSDGAPIDLDEVAGRLAASIEAAWAGRTELDSLGRLVLVAGLRWDEVQILRALQRYRQRIGSRYAEEFRNDVFVAHPKITGKLVAYFEARFALEDDDGPGEQHLHDEVIAMLDGVELLDHDRVLRNHLELVGAIVRTNVYKPGRDVMSFKIRSAEVPGMPGPAPLFEIFIYDADLEGIHIRGGMIARGGLRWSDRMDYRTEVFGLMRAQMTKNAVIVPAGAKGGFYLKRPPADPADLRDAVKASYIRFIEGLLDVTDNLDPSGAVLHPEAVRIRDGEDSYFVVAADKGTATFSDTANEIAVRRGFWLGDAFASGGSVGYDHKKLGITARGAWESVKRHFRELGLDPESDSITAVGIGDMSGDVFGNGMLLSRSMRLIAAYDHRHIFIDPNPEDAERSWQERKRLFELPGSSWADYDESLISAGGAVFPRTLKSLTLTPEIQAALGIEATELAPTDLIKAILAAPVDLLWNGGIGTVVKASFQTDADARDRASDAIRIDATDLRCRVVGEGGNLGFTHRARIEAAQRGVLIFADFIDNSGGVDSSDHEVNLKILLDLAVRRELMTVEERNQLLADVTEDVVQHVLYNSFLQAQILSQEVALSRGRMFAYEDLMDELAVAGIAGGADDALPTDDEMADRRRAGEGMVRPELAVLLAGAKRMLTEQL
nr:NAD-glutamate dehydrogenase [Baekduia sp.]